MRVEVADIRKSTGLSKTFQPGGLLELEGLTMAEPIRGDLKITNAGSRILVEGQVKAVVRLQCSRCDDTYNEHLTLDIDESFIPADSEEARQTPKDTLDEILTYENDKVELLELFRQELLAALPMQAACRVDCKGLCSGCGMNLNHDACRCSKDEIDPRWSALLTLKDDNIKATEKRRKDRPGR